jgi:hypothetical protein
VEVLPWLGVGLPLLGLLLVLRRSVFVFASGPSAVTTRMRGHPTDLFPYLARFIESERNGVGKFSSKSGWTVSVVQSAGALRIEVALGGEHAPLRDAVAEVFRKELGRSPVEVGRADGVTLALDERDARSVIRAVERLFADRILVKSRERIVYAETTTYGA